MKKNCVGRHRFVQGLRRLCLSLSIISAPALADEARWILKKKSDGIAVYARDVADSAIDEIRAEAEIMAPPDVLLAYLLDVANRSHWNTLCTVTETMTGDSKKYSDATQVYLRYDMPWPVEDRDMVMALTPRKDGSGFVAEAVASNYRRDEGAVRVTKAWEQWDIQPTDQGSKLTMTVFMDPAGPIPTWLINSMSVSQPIEVMQRLRMQFAVHTGVN